MEAEQIQANSDEPIRHHKLFRGIMLSFLFLIIAMGSISAFGQGFIDVRPFSEQEIKEVLEIDTDENVVIPADGFRYGIKLFRESITEFFTFDKSDKEELNVRLIDERAKEIVISEARGEPIPDSVVKSYGERIDRAERFIVLQTDDNENIDTRTIVRTALEEHKARFLDRIQALTDSPSQSALSKVIEGFGDRIEDILMRIDQDEIAIVKNTIPIVQQKQANIKLAEMAGDVERIKLEMRELEEIDDKLNRLHLASFCTSPIKTLSLTSFEDIERDCPIAVLLEDEIRNEFTRDEN